MTNKILISFLLGLAISCNSKNNSNSLKDDNENNNIKITQKNMNEKQTRFLLVSDEFAEGTSQFKVREMKSYYDVSEFLSKLWYLFGKPNSLFFEGYNYTIKDKETNIIFTAYSAGSGPSYGGRSEDFEKLEKIITDFELLLNNTPFADCEIELENDFGVWKYGAKDGKPFIEQ